MRSITRLLTAALVQVFLVGCGTPVITRDPVLLNRAETRDQAFDQDHNTQPPNSDVTARATIDPRGNLVTKAEVVWADQVGIGSPLAIYTAGTETAHPAGSSTLSHAFTGDVEDYDPQPWEWTAEIPKRTGIGQGDTIEYSWKIFYKTSPAGAETFVFAGNRKLQLGPELGRVAFSPAPSARLRVGQSIRMQVWLSWANAAPTKPVIVKLYQDGSGAFDFRNSQAQSIRSLRFEAGENSKDFDVVALRETDFVAIWAHASGWTAGRRLLAVDP